MGEEYYHGECQNCKSYRNGCEGAEHSDTEKTYSCFGQYEEEKPYYDEEMEP